MNKPIPPQDRATLISNLSLYADFEPTSAVFEADGYALVYLGPVRVRVNGHKAALAAGLAFLGAAIRMRNHENEKLGRNRGVWCQHCGSIEGVPCNDGCPDSPEHDAPPPSLGPDERATEAKREAGFMLFDAPACTYCGVSVGLKHAHDCPEVELCQYCDKERGKPHAPECEFGGPSAPTVHHAPVTCDTTPLERSTFESPAGYKYTLADLRKARGMRAGLPDEVVAAMDSIGLGMSSAIERGLADRPVRLVDQLRGEFVIPPRKTDTDFIRFARSFADKRPVEVSPRSGGTWREATAEEVEHVEAALVKWYGGGSTIIARAVGGQHVEVCPSCDVDLGVEHEEGCREIKRYTLGNGGGSGS